jgi:hypothetical protein
MEVVVDSGQYELRTRGTFENGDPNESVSERGQHIIGVNGRPSDTSISSCGQNVT